MSQQPYYPPQYPQAPAPQPPQPPQPYAQPYTQQAPMPPYPPAPQYTQPYPQAPQQAPTQPLATGSLDDYYNQPSAATGPSISWSNPDRTPKPIGTTYAGIVVRDVTSADVQQQTDFNTKAPLFYRDGRPKFAMKVPLHVQPSAEFPEGEATWYVKGQARDELVRAMSEAGADGAPKTGAVITIRLVQRRQSGAGLNPANVVQVQYQPAAGQQAPAPQPAPQPVPQPVPQQIQQQAPVAPSPAPEPVQQYAPPAPVQQASQPATQPATQPAAPAPSALSAEQQDLLARLTGQQG